MSKREKVMAVATVFVLAFGIVGAQVSTRNQVIADKRKALVNLERRRVEQRETINMADVWNERYAAVIDQMPIFRTGVQVDTYWFPIMDSVAEYHGVKITSRRALAETTLSDVHEFPIEVRSWEATLDSFLKFMFELQSEGAMLSIRELQIKTIPQRTGYYQGSFVLYCAYMRGEKEEGVKTPAAAPAATPAAAPVIALELDED